MGFNTNTPWPGLLAHHDDGCALRDGGPCTCPATGFRARIDDPLREGPVLGPIFATPDEARAWQREQQVALDAWHAAGRTSTTVGDVIDEFLEAARVGAAVDANGRPYPEGELNDLRWSMHALKGLDATDPRAHLGDLPITALDVGEVRALVERLAAAWQSGRITTPVLDPLRALLRFAAYRGHVPMAVADVLGGDGRVAGPQPTPTTTARVTPIAPAPAPAAATPSHPYPAPGLPLPQPPPAHAPGTIPDEVIWMILKIVTIVFALIALVLVAESV